MLVIFILVVILLIVSAKRGWMPIIRLGLLLMPNAAPHDGGRVIYKPGKATDLEKGCEGASAAAANPTESATNFQFNVSPPMQHDISDGRVQLMIPQSRISERMATRFCLGRRLEMSEKRLCVNCIYMKKHGSFKRGKKCHCEKDD